jgi:hypothetical protein
MGLEYWPNRSFNVGQTLNVFCKQVIKSNANLCTNEHWFSII